MCQHWLDIGLSALPKHLNCGGNVRPCLQHDGPYVFPAQAMQHPWQDWLASHCWFMKQVAHMLETEGLPVRYSLIVSTTPSRPRSSFQCRVFNNTACSLMQTWHLGCPGQAQTPGLSLQVSSAFLLLPSTLKAHYVTPFSATPLRTSSQSSELILNESYAYWLIVNLSGTCFKLIDAVF